MATFTITTAQNIDELTVKAGADTYNIDGGTLTIDQNTLFGQNTGTAGGLGNITISASLGGTVEIDARYVRQIPYDAGSGNVPAYNTVISGGGASGKLIGVTSGLNTAVTAPGAAMPATGFILVKQWNSVAYADNTVLSGITATVNGTDAAAMMYVVGNEAAARAITCVRLGKFRARGTWYEIGTTTGTSTSTYTFPTYGESNCMLPGVWVETGTGTNVYEFYPTDRRVAAANQLGTEAERGKFIYQTVTTAVATFRIGHDGTNTNGYTPPAGRKIRIPNLWLVDATAAAIASPTTTIATRPEFVTTGGGDVEFDTVVSHWYLNFAQPYAISLNNVATEAIVLSECATPVSWTNVCTGPLTTTVQNPFTMSLNFAGGTFSKLNMSRYSLVATTVLSMTDCDGFTFTDCNFVSPSARTGTALLLNLTRTNNCTFTNMTALGGQITLTTCNACTFTNTKYIDRPVYANVTNNVVYGFSLASACKNVTIDGFTLPVPRNGPGNGIFNLAAAGHDNIKIRNIGTAASPLDAGEGAPAQYSWTRTTTTATVTWTAHGMAVGDVFYVLSSSSTGAITNATTYTVATVVNANSFTFTCTNGGNASGTFTAWKTSMQGLGAFTAGAAATNVKVQRVYLKNTRRTQASPDNSFKNVLIENCDFEENVAITATGLNQKIKDVYARASVTAASSVYGTHWFWGRIADTNTKTAASWSRTTTTATFTVTDHGLMPGDEILITNSNSTAAIPNGRYAVTLLGTSNTFTITCLNAGNASGTADYEVINGRIGIVMNEETAQTTGTYSLDAGTPKFTSAGTLAIPAVNDQITWTTPDSIYNFTGFPALEPIFSGTNVTLSNHEAYYALDTGSGFGAYKQLMFPRAGGGGSGGSTNITMTDTTGVVVGTYIFGTGVAQGAKVQSITNGTTIVATIANVSTVSGILRFSDLPNETVSATGFKMKVRLKSVAANSTTTFSSIQINATASGTNQYPLDQATVQLTNLVSGSDIVITQYNTTNVIVATDQTSGTNYSTTIDPSTYPAIDISIFKPGYIPYILRNLSLTAAGLSLPMNQVVDPSYVE